MSAHCSMLSMGVQIGKSVSVWNFGLLSWVKIRLAHIWHWLVPQTIIEGPYVGNYYSMGQHTGGCLYRFRINFQSTLELQKDRDDDDGNNDDMICWFWSEKETMGRLFAHVTVSLAPCMSITSAMKVVINHFIFKSDQIWTFVISP